MDNYENFDQPFMHIGRSKRMENAAMVLAVISIACSMVLYISLPCGAVAIILALLSKGSTGSITSRAQTAMILGIVGLFITVAVYTWSFVTLYQAYGSIDAMLEAIYEQTGVLTN